MATRAPFVGEARPSADPGQRIVGEAVSFGRNQGWKQFVIASAHDEARMLC